MLQFKSFLLETRLGCCVFPQVVTVVRDSVLDHRAGLGLRSENHEICM